jgi:hypothetical protein
MIEIETATDRDLLALFASVMDELRGRGVVRSSNSPGADYAELLVSKALKLKLNTASTAGYDGTDSRGKKYEVKCRRVTKYNKSRQLSAIRGLEHKHFDFLVGVLFDSDFRVNRVALVPYRVVRRHSSFVASTNSWKFLLRDSVWSLRGVEDITAKVRKAQRWE